MANGTIAFDTLSTSGQITGTAKSLDTDYVVTGSPRAWINYATQASFETFASLNISSVSDQGAGSAHITVTNSFSSADYTYVVSSNQFHIQTDSKDSNKTSSKFAAFSYNSSNSLNDANETNAIAIGDLA